MARAPYDQWRWRSVSWLIALAAVPFSTVDAQVMNRGGLMPPGSGARAPSAPSRPTPYYRPESNILVKEIRITGNRHVTENKIRSHLKTRTDRVFDPALLQADVRSLISTGRFDNVKTYTENVPGGIAVTYHVFERPTIGYVRFVGSKQVKRKTLLRECGLKEGEPLNTFAVSEGRRKLEEYYRARGNSKAQVTIVEGDKPEHGGVAYRIHEGPRQRILWTEFEGNTAASDRRLRTQIQSKPGILWMFKGKVDLRKIDEDQEALTAYYRSLGYFQAKVGRELKFTESDKWLTITFTIDEGARYKVRDIRLVGNEKFANEELAGRLELKPGDYYNLAKLRRDEATLRDVYGSHGHIMADIKAEPRFLEQAGVLDLVYDIKEGDQYRVGRIFVNIEGDQAHTRRSVVLNRMSLRPGDIVDIREIRNSKRRLTASQLFLNDPARGITPDIVVKPSQFSRDAASIADQHSATPPDGGTVRGQSPPGSTLVDRWRAFKPPGAPGPSAVVDLHVYVVPESQISRSAP